MTPTETASPTGHKTPSVFRCSQVVEKEDIAAALERVAIREQERPAVSDLPAQWAPIGHY